MNFSLSSVVPTNIANAASSATAALNKAKEAADKLAEEMLKEHLKLVDKNLGSIEGEVVTSSNAMLPDLVKGANLSALIYDFKSFCANLPSTTQLSVLNKEVKLFGALASAASALQGNELMDVPAQPDVVAIYDPSNDDTKTVWVVCRGSVSVTDFIGDLMWLTSSNVLGDLPLPELPVVRSNVCLPKLLEFIEKSSKSNDPPKRVCFTGHSLGGAVASGIFFKYHMYVPNPLDTLVVTLGSPQMLKKNMPTKVSWHPGLAHDVDLNKLESKCHHIVQRYDITPRIVGPHELPSSFFSIPLIGESLKSFAATLNRDTFCCYGKFYSLNPSHEGRSSTSLKAVKNGVDILGKFPDVKFFMQALKNDHGSDVSAVSMAELLPAYNNGYVYTSSKDLMTRKIKDKPALKMPSEFEPKPMSKSSVLAGAAGMAAVGVGAAAGLGAMAMDRGGDSGGSHKPRGSQLAVSADDLCCPSSCFCCSCAMFFKIPECLGMTGSGGCCGCCECGYRCGCPTNCSCFRQDQCCCCDTRSGCGSAVPFMLSVAGCICIDLRFKR